MNTIKQITAGVSAFQELFSTEKNRINIKILFLIYFLKLIT